MKKRYEALLVLNTRGKEDSAKDIIERLEKDFAAEGVTVEQVQRLERREFAYEHNHQKSGYYVNFIIETDPVTLEKLRGKFKLDADVTLQNYLVLPAAKAAA
ncbi:MAG TPA: 30S ribosomal protein S6 [Chthoniobacterales bacterium]|jgi:small subunit ribosomal protein S6